MISSKKKHKPGRGMGSDGARVLPCGLGTLELRPEGSEGVSCVCIWQNRQQMCGGLEAGACL